MYSVVDLFAGAGGISAGLRDVRDAAGESKFRTIQAVEKDFDAAASFASNFPHAEVLQEDIQRVVSREEIRGCDVVVGGPPCQGFSRLGNGDPSRLYNDLWRSYADAIVQASPKYFLMENVPQFLHSPERNLFEMELEEGSLKDYEIAGVAILNSADFGVAQNRRRMVILGNRRDQPKIDYPQPLNSPIKTVKQAWEGIDQKVTQIDLPKKFNDFKDRTRPGPFLSNELHLGRRYTSLSVKRMAHIKKPGGNRFDLPEDLQPDCWKKHRSGNTDVMGRLFLDRPSVTIRTEFFKPEKGRYLHPVEDRAITHLEAIRLMGFDDNYLWVGSKTSIARQIGNAVPPPLAKSLGEMIAKALDLNVQHSDEMMGGSNG